MASQLNSRSLCRGKDRWDCITAGRYQIQDGMLMSRVWSSSHQKDLRKMVRLKTVQRKGNQQRNMPEEGGKRVILLLL